MTAPATSTHDLAIGATVVKRYTSWDRGEPEREWTVLTRVHAGAPGLGPVPLRSGLTEDPPWLELSRVPGSPLGGVLSAGQRDGLMVALRRLWSVPVGDLPYRR